MADKTVLDALVSEPAADATSSAPEPAIVTRIVGGPPRTKAFPLKWPVRHGDLQIDEIVLSRVTAGELSDYFEALREGRKAVLPVLKLKSGEPVPVEVLAALDADDDAAIGKEAESFLPLALRREDPPSPSTSTTSPASLPQSSASASRT